MENDKNILKEYIKKEFLNDEDIAVFTEQTPLVSSRILDSISTLELVDFIEKQFSIEFNHHEVDQDNLDTIEKICAFVNSKKQ